MEQAPEKSVRVFIVDDERPARENLADLLKRHPGVEIAGEARNAAEAKEKISRERPDLLFLDIQMPGGSGFDLLERLEDPPPVVFVTAHDQFAIRAFQVNALDYLLKPVDPDRLGEALRRAGDRSRGSAGPENALSPGDRVFLNTGKQSLFLPVMEIAAIASEGNYTHVIDVRGKRHMVRSPLWIWEKRLPGDFFVTLDRSLMINLRHVRSWTARLRKAEVRLAGVPAPFALGRAAYRRFRERVAGAAGDPRR
ncbi:MAG TPA: response regulator transcription factor [Syntrophales bacterium]|nr:response regulator transcription factor [Syntrophales bacterium]HQB30863.1 response regulator transcription factor [Syntrophales bacterium]HQQ27694.1 response regulator transcription factor [Syntrophales bacterium]